MKKAMLCEREHDFVLVMTGNTELVPELENALYKAGCDDATVSMRSGRLFLTFTREAPSLREAILSAIRDVKKVPSAGQVLRVDDCNLVTQAEIARKIDRPRQIVHQFITGTRGPGGFPGPACHITDNAPLWRWCDVAYWLWENNMIKENALQAALDVQAINAVLDLVHTGQLDPALVTQVLKELGGSLFRRSAKLPV